MIIQSYVFHSLITTSWQNHKHHVHVSNAWCSHTESVQVCLKSFFSHRNRFISVVWMLQFWLVIFEQSEQFWLTYQFRCKLIGIMHGTLIACGRALIILVRIRRLFLLLIKIPNKLKFHLKDTRFRIMQLTNNSISGISTFFPNS